MRRSALDTVTRFAGRLRSGQRPALPDQGPVRLNLGSSLSVAEGWINIDGGLGALLAGLPRPLLKLAYRLSGSAERMSEGEFVDVLSRHRFVHHDLAYGIPFPDGCAEAIFSSHFFEHISRADAERLMGEAHRVLAPGGVIRTCVPNLGWLVDEYNRGNKRLMVDGIFGDDGHGEYARHRYMYDDDLLGELLTEAGFTEVRSCGFREGRTPDLDVLDNREGSLMVEAVKPGG
jgi:predicted SAM-dependent methyltransferase